MHLAPTRHARASAVLRPVTGPFAAALAVALCVCAALVCVPVPAAHAAGGDFGTTDLPEVTVEGYPSTLLMGKDLVFHAQTKEGTVAQEYGLSAGVTVDERMRGLWSTSDLYGHESALDHLRAPDRNGPEPAIADIDADGSVDIAYLTLDGANAKWLVVRGSEEDGFPLLGVAPVQADAQSVTVTDPVPSTSGGPARALILVQLPGGLHVYRWSPATSTVKRLEFSVGGVPVAGYGIPNATTLAIHHRPVTDRLSGEPLGADDPDVTALVTDESGYLKLYLADFTYDGANDRVVPDLGPSVATLSQAPFPYVYTQARVKMARSALSEAVVVSARDNQPTPANVVKTKVGNLPAFQDLGSGCQGRSVASVDLELVRTTNPYPQVIPPVGGVAACAVWASGSPTLRGAVATSEDLGSSTVKDLKTWEKAYGGAGSQIPSAAVGGAPQPQVVLPCRSLLAHAPANQCSSNDQGASWRTLGQVGVSTTFAAASPTWSGATFHPFAHVRTWRTVLHPGVEKRAGLGAELMSSTADLLPTGSTGDPSGYLAASLPTVDQTIDITLDSLVPITKQGDPVPRAFLAAPPAVAGAGQSVDGPSFATFRGTEQENSTTMEFSQTISVGVEVEDPTGAFGASADLALTHEVGSTVSSGFSSEVSEIQVGSPSENSVVVDSVNLHRYTGTVTASTTGVGIGTTSTVDVPHGSTTKVLTESYLRKNFPEYADGTGFLDPVLDEVFGHDVGDPGSYLSFDTATPGTELDAYCDGGYTDGADRELSLRDPGVAPNPFGVVRPAEPARPDVLVSTAKTVVPGSIDTGAGNSFTLGTTTSDSRTRSLGAEVTASMKAAYFTFGVTTGFTWSDEWSTTLSEGVSFSSMVRNPDDTDLLAGEGYDWRSFLCQKTVATPRGPVTAWVLDYTVDDYFGTGGLADLGPVGLTQPVYQSVTSTLSPVLEWEQLEGDIAAYTWHVRGGDQGTAGFELSGSGGTWPTLEQARTRPLRTQATVPDALQPGHRYEWWVTARDFFGNERTSATGVFHTPGDGAGGTGSGGATTLVEDDAYAGSEDMELAPAGSVLDNDRGAAAASLHTGAQHGTVSLSADGRFRYQPDRDFCGDDTFAYSVSGGLVGRVALSVRCVNDAPRTRRDVLRLSSGKVRLVVGRPGLLRNDTDVEGSRIRARLVARPSVGKAVVRRSGKVVYTAPARRPRRTTFTYRACDDQGACSRPRKVVVRLR